MDQMPLNLRLLALLKEESSVRETSTTTHPRKGLLRLVTEVLALADRTTDVVRDSKEPKDEKEVGPE